MGLLQGAEFHPNFRQEQLFLYLFLGFLFLSAVGYLVEQCGVASTIIATNSLTISKWRGHFHPHRGSRPGYAIMLLIGVYIGRLACYDDKTLSVAFVTGIFC